MGYRPTDDALAAQKKKYYAKHQDLSPQSTWSRLLELFGQDEPFAPDSRSYDYRKQAWDESQAAGNPDIGWMLPELTDDMTEKYVDATGDLPDSMKGTVEREGDPVSGFLAHTADQVNYTPWDTGDILSVLSDSSPDTVRRDIMAYKGGPSSLDRVIEDAVGAPHEKDWEPGYRDSWRDPAVETSEWTGMVLPFGVIGKTLRGAKSVGTGVKKAAGAIRKRVAPKGIGTQLPAPYTETTASVSGLPRTNRAADGRSLRDTIAQATRANTAKAAQRAVPGAGLTAALAGGGATAGGILTARELEERRKRRIRGE